MSRFRPSLLPLGVLLLVAFVVPVVRADVGPGIKIRWSGDWPAPARPGVETVGQFEIVSVNAGIVENLRVEGEGWSQRSLDAPSRLVMPPRSNRRFTFRAVPSDPKAPIVVSGTVNGVPFRKHFRLDEESLSKIGKPRPARLQGASVMGAPEGSGEGTQAAIRFRGRVVYTRSDNAVVGADNIHVKIMDDDIVFPFIPEQIGSVITDAAGNFDVTIDWNDTDDIGGPDAPDVYLLIESGNSVVQVRTDDTEQMYVWTTESWTFWDFTGTDLNFGDIIPLTDIPAVHLFTAVVKANRHATGIGGMPAPHVKVNWPDSDDRSYYDPNEIHISTAQSWNEGTAVHEYGHHLSYSFSSLLPTNYENGFCDTPRPGHCVWCPENDTDAWQEGWANWFASRMLRVWEGAYGYEPLSIDDFRYTLENVDVCQQDLMTYRQSDVENIIGALLRDIEDGENEGVSGETPSDPFDCSGDRLSLDDQPIFVIFRDDDPANVWEFLQSFRARHPNHDRDLWNTIEHTAPSLNFLRPVLAISSQPPACQSARAGATISLEVAANGGIVRYRWHRNGVPLFNGSGVTGAFTRTLQLGPLTPNLAGSYTCQAIECDGVTTVFSSGTEVRVDPAAPPATPFLSWGVNGQGTVGDGTTSDTRPPSVHAGMNDIVAVEGGAGVTIALRAGGQVLTWGTPQAGELGQGQWWTPNYTPTPILSGIAKIAAGKNHGLALELDGTLKVWGSSFYGQLFRGNRDDLNTPQPAMNLGCVKDLAAGDAHSLALLGDGTIRSVGYNAYGCLGVGTTTIMELTPQAVPLTNVVAIQAAYLWSMALRADSTVWTWGINTSGQLGLGHFNTVSTPTQVPGLTGIKQIFAGESNGYALRSDGKLFAWGYGPAIGVGYTGGSSWSPLEVPLSNVSKVGGGFSWAMAIVDGNLWGWGLNAGGSPTTVGILNNTGPYVQPSPVPIIGLFNVTDIFGGWTTAHAFGQPGVLRVTPTPAADRPTVLALAARPNPARGSAALHFDLPDAAPVRLRVYDAAGRFVRELVDEDREAGRYVTTWDGRSTTGARVSAGLYFVRLQAGSRTMSRTLIRIE